jgi:O-antigen ligase
MNITKSDPQEKIIFRSNRAFHKKPGSFIIACVIGLLMGLAILWLSPVWTLVGLIGVILIIVSFKRPELIFLGYLIVRSTIIDENILPRLSIGVGRLVFTDLFLLYLFAIVLIRLLAEPNFKIIHTVLDLPILAFVGIALLSSLLAILQSRVTIYDSLGDIRITISYLLFFPVVYLIRGDQQLQVIFKGIIILAGIVALTMIAQFIFGESIHILPGRVETLGTEGVSFMGVTRIIPPGESLVFVAFITLTVLIAVDKLQWKNIWIVLLWGLSGVGVVLTFKRNLWIAVLISMFLLALLSWGKVRLKMVVGILLVFTVATFVFLPFLSQPGSEIYKLAIGAIDRIASLGNPQTYEDPNSSLRWRDFETQYALPQIISHPILGLGLGARYRPFVPGKDSLLNNLQRFIHNGHLGIMVKSGLPAYLFFLAFSLISIIRGFKFWRLITDRQSKAILLGFSLSYLGILIGSIVSAMIVKTAWTPIIGIMFGINEVVINQGIPK